MKPLAFLTPFIATAALALLQAPAHAGGMDSLAAFMKSAQSGKAAFTQVVTAPAKQGQAPRSKTQSGTFEFQRPGKFRFAYAKPFEQTIVADGQTLWLHDADLNQVSARKQEQVLGSTPAAIVAAAADVRALQKDFTLTDEPDSEGQQWVKAVPKAREGQVQSIRVGFAPQPAGVPQLATLEIQDSFGQRSVLRFTGFEVNPAFAPTHFQFTPPKGADVIRQ